ncbi:hypothetical protein VQH23_23855 [Pararoseomonas sp. SCSIO 73927]|uniref:hypothetical protein n=1 Tax=Pararoseomonas sp. SCSIO 73927 TaxID=3114537 RepID=UPI0030D60874
MQDLDTPSSPRANPRASRGANQGAGGAAQGTASDLVIAAVQDLVYYARAADLPLADEVLTDVLAKLSGWPVEELNRLR